MRATSTRPGRPVMARGTFASFGAAALVVALLLFSKPLAAQEGISFTGKIGGGFTNPVYSAGKNLDTGWNIGAGAGINFTRQIGVLGEFQYNQFGINSTTLTNLQFPDGNMHMWSLTANPMLQTNRSGLLNAFVIGGGGLYRRTIEFTSPTVATVTAFDPFLGLFFPVGVPVDQILTSHSVMKGGLNIGGGISIRLGASNRSRVFVEARYHHMYTRPNATTVLPVTFGFQW